MESSMKTNICASAAIFLALALAGGAAADALVPFNGSLQGQETDILQGDPPQQILVNGEVRGVATHLGRFTMTYNVTVSLPAGTSTGSAEWVAANGDRIYTTIVGYGHSVPGMPGLNRIVEINTITGGTGRFTSAQGSFLVERLVDLTTGRTSGSFQEGTITSPGVGHE